MTISHALGFPVMVNSSHQVNLVRGEDFKRAMDVYAGVTGSNYAEVTRKLLELGINDQAGQVPARAGSSDMDVGGYSKRRAEGHALMGLPPIPKEHLSNCPEMPNKRLLDAFPFEERPSWAAKLIDKRQVMPWNS